MPPASVALLGTDSMGADAIVATGLEAGGHRVSFDRSAEESLVGGIALVHERGMVGQALETGQGADILEGFFGQLAEQMVPAQG